MKEISVIMEKGKRKYWKVPAEIAGLYLALAIMVYCGIIVLGGSVSSILRDLAIAAIVAIASGIFLYMFYDICGRLPFTKSPKKGNGAKKVGKPA